MREKYLNSIDLIGHFVPTIDRAIVQPKVYEYSLEGLRGLAAIWVAYSHIFFYEFKLDPSYHPTFPFGTFLNAAHGAILVFFALSGYVIGLTNRLPFSRSNVIRYVLRRFIRIYPIYFIAVALGVLSNPTDTWKTIVGNLLFMQGPVSALLSGNGVLWTLHYEIVYYIIFIGVWYYRPRILPLFIVSLTVAFLPTFFPTFPKIISGYAAGWMFWLFGLWLAWKKSQSQSGTKFPLFSYILLYIATDKLEIGATLLKELGLTAIKFSEISILDFVYFPLCALLLASITQRKLPHSLSYSSFAVALLLIQTTYLFTSGKLSFNELIAVAHMFMGFVFLRWKVSPSIFSYLSFFGSISYGIYVFHMPILNLMSKFLPFSGSPITFLIRTFIWAGLTILVSYFFELKIQPLLKLYFQKQVLSHI
jgi:peptidoglycan/LPS O-acetylase OafA/YrhL